jgi:hypothetical protein
MVEGVAGRVHVWGGIEHGHLEATERKRDKDSVSHHKEALCSADQEPVRGGLSIVG